MVDDRVRQWRKQANTLEAQARAAKTVLTSARQAVIEAEDEYDAADEAQKIAQVIAETIQEEAHDRIAGVVTKCLATVFPDEPYTFKIRFERARGRTEARLVFVREEQEISPMDASEGGAIDVAAFALRVSSLMLSRPARRRLIVLDEPFRFLDKWRPTAVRTMLESLAKDLGVQFVMITHNEGLRCGHVVDLG